MTKTQTRKETKIPVNSELLNFHQVTAGKNDSEPLRFVNVKGDSEGFVVITATDGTLFFQSKKKTKGLPQADYSTCGDLMISPSFANSINAKSNASGIFLQVESIENGDSLVRKQTAILSTNNSTISEFSTGEKYPDFDGKIESYCLGPKISIRLNTKLLKKWANQINSQSDTEEMILEIDVNNWNSPIIGKTEKQDGEQITGLLMPMKANAFQEALRFKYFSEFVFNNIENTAKSAKVGLSDSDKEVLQKALDICSRVSDSIEFDIDEKLQAEKPEQVIDSEVQKMNEEHSAKSGDSDDLFDPEED